MDIDGTTILLPSQQTMMTILKKKWELALHPKPYLLLYNLLSAIHGLMKVPFLNYQFRMKQEEVDFVLYSTPARIRN